MRGSDERSGSRSRYVVGVCVLALLGAAIAGWFLLGAGDTRDETGREPDVELIAVARTDLTVGTSLQGELGFGSTRTIPFLVSGTVTWLPPVGMKAELGDPLVKVDNRPVVLLYGETPAYRAMSAGSGGGPRKPGGSPADSPDAEPVPPTPPSTGPDVEQLEAGLSALGYTGFDVDEEFTPGTAAAVRRWQRDLGIPETGTVALGDVVFLPEPVRLHPDADALGRPISDTSVTRSGTTKLVTVEAESADWATKGARVRVLLPSQRSVPGRVVASAATVDTESGAGPGKQVRISLDRPPRGVGQVTVTYVSAQRRGVLAVPVTALVAVAEGGYAVQREDGEYVAVQPGLYAEGLVEISGAVGPGTRVRVPR
ncbi:peptidoglycan-binding domain-containing protein [Nocardioides marmoriginsengisoli]|nr:peptidoglycan-binding domain-containing protein [Nocardioides marmoriginsengisoli]